MDRSITGAKAPSFQVGETRSLSRVWLIARRRPLLVFSLIVILALVLMAIFAKSLAPYDPNSITGRRLAPPSAAHRFGTDSAGRDVLSRAIVGSQLSLTVGVTIAITGTVIGTILGGYSGFVGGRSDLLLQRLIDVLQSIPALILSLAIVSVLTPSTKNLIVGLFWIFIPGSTRVIRSTALSVRSREFVTSARVVGASELRIFILHVLPQLMAPFLILISIGVGFGILIESSLEFLGVGPLPPAVSWGGMMTGATTLAERAPWVLLAPSIGLGLTVYAFNLLGDSLRDLLDPRLRT
jgi:peptide/nickel transport system permease protein